KANCPTPTTCTQAADASVPGGGSEVAHFVIGLVAAGGKGVVFDGATLGSNAAFKSRIQSASGAALGSIAVGKLVVQ
ncbi:MAG TPA: hypothetical protein VF993_12070, partial [Myxococcales bacterium]